MSLIMRDLDRFIILRCEPSTFHNIMSINKHYLHFMKSIKIFNRLFIMRKFDLNGKFRVACINNFYDVVEYFISEENINTDMNAAFCLACEYGNLQIAKYLIGSTNSSQYPKINIHLRNEYAFRYSCQNGHREVVKYLKELSNKAEYGKINIHSIDHYLFVKICNNENLVKYLVELGNGQSYNKINIEVVQNAINALKMRAFRSQDDYAEIIQYLKDSYNN